jgi:hypothetical protein
MRRKKNASREETEQRTRETVEGQYAFILFFDVEIQLKMIH